MSRFCISPVKGLLACILTLGLCVSAAVTRADELPVAEGSALAAIAFDDKPLVLPIQRNFQMAMLSASSELGRSCGAIEAYGWRLRMTEQDHVNAIFNSAVDKMRAQGFAVESKTLGGRANKDVTLFTADRGDHNLLFMWSAGDVGLVLVICETSAPAEGRLGRVIDAANSHDMSRRPTSLSASQASTSHGGRVLSAPRAELGPARRPPASVVEAMHREMNAALGRDALTVSLVDPATKVATSSVRVKAAPVRSAASRLPVIPPAKLIGDWRGTYACAQGETGATLTIASMKHDHFEGLFRFYPTVKNPTVPTGSYTVSGEFDPDTHKILINPGHWVKRPNHFYNTIIIGGFDVAAGTLSATFQGITGCTSFEAHYRGKQTNVSDELRDAKAQAKKKPIAHAERQTSKSHKVKKDIAIQPLPPAADSTSGGLAIKGGVTVPPPADPLASIALPGPSLAIKP